MSHHQTGTDHLVYCVPGDLDSACADFAARTGVWPAQGGVHKGRGTHNALVRIGPRAYLELLAVDVRQATPPWLGASVSAPPRISTWAVRALLPDTAETLTRGQSVWRLALEPDYDGVVPFRIDWTNGHPCDALPDARIALRKLVLQHPEPAAVKARLAQIGIELEVELGAPRIEAELLTPNGVVLL